MCEMTQIDRDKENMFICMAITMFAVVCLTWSELSSVFFKIIFIISIAAFLFIPVVFSFLSAHLRSYCLKPTHFGEWKSFDETDCEGLNLKLITPHLSSVEQFSRSQWRLWKIWSEKEHNTNWVFSPLHFFLVLGRFFF